jgi:hypothetical protein
MTTPDERTCAVIATRRFLETVARTCEPVAVPGLVSTVAEALLSHYPRDADLFTSASALPELWGTPPRESKRLRLVRGGRQ